MKLKACGNCCKGKYADLVTWKCVPNCTSDERVVIFSDKSSRKICYNKLNETRATNVNVNVLDHIIAKNIVIAVVMFLVFVNRKEINLRKPVLKWFRSNQKIDFSLEEVNDVGFVKYLEENSVFFKVLEKF